MGHFTSCPGQLKEEHALCGRKGYPPASHFITPSLKQFGSLPLPRALLLSKPAGSQKEVGSQKLPRNKSELVRTDRLSLGLSPLPSPILGGRERIVRTRPGTGCEQEEEAGTRQHVRIETARHQAHSPPYTQPQRSLNHTLRNFLSFSPRGFFRRSCFVSRSLVA